MATSSTFGLVVRVCKCKAQADVFALLASAAPATVGRTHGALSSWFVGCLIEQLRAAAAAPPKKPGEAVSLTHLQNVYLSLELVWEWRVRRFLEEVAAENCSHNFLLPRMDAIPAVILGCCAKLQPFPIREEAFEAVQSLCDVVHSSAFNGLALQRNMGRIMAAFAVLASTSPEGAVTRLSERYLQVLIRGPFQHRVVFGFQSTGRCSASVRKRITALMQEFLFLPAGLEAVVRGYLPEAPGERTAEHVGMVVRALTSVPESYSDGSSKEAYFSALAPQLVQLIRDAAQANDDAVLEVCAGVVSRLFVLCPAVAHAAVIKQLGRPLLQLLRPQSHATGPSISVKLPLRSAPSSSVLSTHAEVEAAVLGLAALVRANLGLRHSARGGGGGSFMGSLHRSGVAQALIYLAVHWHAQSNKSSSSSSGGGGGNELGQEERGPEAVLVLLRCYFRALPQLSARQFELVVVIPSVNSFSSSFATTAGITIAASGSRGAGSCSFEIRNGSPRGPEALALGEDAADAESRACEETLQRGRGAIQLLVGTLLLQPSRDEPAGAVEPMVAALFLRTLRAFFGVQAEAGGDKNDDDDDENTDAEAGCGEKGDADSGSEAAEEAAAARDYVSSSGSGLLFPLLLELTPRRILSSPWLRPRALAALRLFLDGFMNRWGDGVHALPINEGKGEDEDDGGGDEETAVAMAGAALDFLHELLLSDAQSESPTPSPSPTESKAPAQASDLRSLLPCLERLAAWRSGTSTRAGADLAQRAAELGLSILTVSVGGDVPTRNLAAGSSPTSASDSSISTVPAEVQELLSSEQPPMRALGAKSLVYLLLGPERAKGHAPTSSALIEVIEPPLSGSGSGSGDGSGSGKDAPELSEAIAVLLSLLRERESFVYLNALHGLCSLALHRRHRGPVLDALLEVWDGRDGGLAALAVPDEVAGAVGGSIRLRSLVGEGLFLVVRRMQGLCDAATLGRVAASCLRVVRASHAMHLATASAPTAGDSAAALAVGEEDPLFLQASALSLLAECAAVSGGVAAERFLPDALDVVSHVLLMPRPGLPAALTAELRRASAFLLSRTLTGLGKQVFFLNEGRSVGAAYKAIKVCRASPDTVVRWHGENAFSVLGDLMAEQFPGMGV